MYYVYFARFWANEEQIAECRTLEAARTRADEEFDLGARDIEVYDADGCVVYEPDEEFLIDEY